MAGTIKGITIEFKGDTTQLDSALKQINTNTRSLDSELKKVNNALKFNPTSVELWKQKQTLLSQKVQETKAKLDALKQAQAQLDAKNVDKNSQEYRELQREIITTESKLDTFKGQLKAVGNVKLRATSESLKAIGSKATAAGQAMTPLSQAAGVMVGALGALTVKAGVWADDLNTLAKKYNLNTKELQLYSAAADLVDVDVDTIAKSHVKLTRAMSQAQQGSKNQTEAFKKLGISITDSNGELRDGDEVWQQAIKALGGIKNETERDAIAMQLFGKSAAELNPLIEDGGETYKELSETLKKYDLDFIDQETLDNANEFNDKLDTMKAVGGLAFQSLGASLAEKLAPFLEKVVGLVGNFAKWLANLNPVVVLIAGGIGALVAAAAPLLLLFGALVTAAGTVAGALATISAPVVAAVAGIGALIAVFVAALASSEKFRNAVLEVGKKIAKAFEPVVKQLISTIKGLIETIKDTVKSVANQLAPVLEKLEPIFTFIANVIAKVLVLALKGLKNQFEIVGGVIKVIVTIFATAFDSIVKLVQSAYNSLKKSASDIIKALDFNALMTSIKNWFANTFNTVTTTLTGAANTIKTIATSIINALNFNLLMTSIKTWFQSIKDGIVNRITEAKNALTLLVQQIKTVFDFNSLVTAVATTFENVKEGIKSKLLSAKEAVRTVVGQIKTVANFDTIITTAKATFESVKTGIKEKLVSAKDAIKTVVSQIQSVLGFSGIVSSVKSVFSSVKDAIKNPIDSAKDAISNIVSKIKGFFPLKLGKIFSGIKLPHFNISGGKIPWGIGGKGVKPSITIDWYAKGGIFNAPTLAGIGEAGPEAVVPLDKFWRKLDAMQGGETVINVYAAPGMDVEQLAEAVQQRIIQLEQRRKQAWA